MRGVFVQRRGKRTSQEDGETGVCFARRSAIVFFLLLFWVRVLRGECACCDCRESPASRSPVSVVFLGGHISLFVSLKLSELQVKNVRNGPNVCTERSADKNRETSEVFRAMSGSGEVLCPVAPLLTGGSLAAAATRSSFFLDGMFVPVRDEETSLCAPCL